MYHVLLSKGRLSIHVYFASVCCLSQALTELEHVTFLKIEGAPPEEVEALVAEKLGPTVVDIDDPLFKLMEEMCTGNPLIITELVSHLKVHGVRVSVCVCACAAPGSSEHMIRPP